jgi:hypothetical protein
MTTGPRPPHASAASALSAALLALAFIFAAGCGDERQDNRPPTAEEQALLTRLSRDPAVVVQARERNQDGYLVVTTRQGAITVRYVFAPDRFGEKTLNLHRVDDSYRLKEGPQGGGVLPHR